MASNLLFPSTSKSSPMYDTRLSMYDCYALLVIIYSFAQDHRHLPLITDTEVQRAVPAVPAVPNKVVEYSRVRSTLVSQDGSQQAHHYTSAKKRLNQICRRCS